MRRSDSSRKFLLLFLVAIAILALSCQIGDRVASETTRTTTVAQVAQICLPSVVLVTVGGIRGSGVVLTWDGKILTNHHMTRPAGNYRVKTYSGRLYRAILVRSDAATDLALLRITDLREILTPMKFCPYPPIIGETVVVIGNALGRGHIVTSGIVSSVDQRVRIRGQIEFTGMVQSDAPINPGNSGGALLTITGRLLGIVNTTNFYADGVGWAIPIATVRRFLAGR